MGMRNNRTRSKTRKLNKRQQGGLLTGWVQKQNKENDDSPYYESQNPLLSQWNEPRDENLPYYDNNKEFITNKGAPSLWKRGVTNQKQIYYQQISNTTGRKYYNRPTNNGIPVKTHRQVVLTKANNLSNKIGRAHV